MNALKHTLLLLIFFSLTSVAESPLAGGEWTKKNFKIKGTWSIEKAADGTLHLKVDGDFKTRNAPDLKFVLHPLALEQVNDRNAMSGAKVVALLQKNKGAQSYAIPNDVDLKDYKSVLLHCEQYSKLWGGAAL